MGRESGWNQGHLDVLMGVGLQFAEHWLQLQVVSAHQPRFLKFKLQLLVLVHVVKDYEPVADLAAL